MASAIDRRFQMAEQQLRRKELQREQQEKEGLKRRFAAIGGLGSGASIKAEKMAGEEASKRLSEGSQRIEMQRLGEQARQEEIEAQRAFQRGEREAGQTFAEAMTRRQEEFTSGQAQKQREFASAERLAGQEFASGERASAQEFAQQQAAEQSALAKELQGMKDAMSQQQIDLQQKELQLNELVSVFNMGNAEGFANLLAEKYGITVGGAEGVQELSGGKAVVPAHLSPAQFAGGGRDDMIAHRRREQQKAEARKRYLTRMREGASQQELNQIAAV